MKRTLSTLLILLLVISACTLSGCSPDTEAVIEESLDNKNSELITLITDAEDISVIRNYLISWANDNDIRVSYDEYGNVIFSSKATEGYKDAETNIFQCTIDLDEPEATASSIAVALSIIEEAENHGFIRILFTPPGGISSILKTYITADNFISLDWNEKNSILVGSAGSDVYKMTSDIKWTSPSYTNAYRIEIDGLPSNDFATSDKFPNPITIVGDILATAKSSNILLEIAEFNGGTASDVCPSGVSCTILINQKDVGSMKKRLQSAIENCYDKYTLDSETFTFTFEEVEVPDEIISYEDTANIISFLYTCIDGNYLKDDAGEVIAKSNIGLIKTSDKGFEAEVCVKSKSADVLQEMETTFETICGLSNISFSKTTGDPVWETNTVSDDGIYSEENTLGDADESELNTLITRLKSASTEITGKTPKTARTFDKTACAAAAKRNPNMNIVAICSDNDHMLETTETILLYLESGNAVAAEQ